MVRKSTSFPAHQSVNIEAVKQTKLSNKTSNAAQHKEARADSFVGVVKKIVATGLLFSLAAPNKAQAVDETRLPAAWLRGKYLTPRNATQVDEKIFGLGLNVMDDHNCGTNGTTVMNPPGVIRYLDFVAKNFKFPVARYNLELGDFSNGKDGNQIASLARQMEHVDYLGKSLNKLVIVSLWIHPSLSGAGKDGAPTTATDGILTALADYANTRSYMMIGLNENHPNDKTPAAGEDIRQRLQHMVNTIRLRAPSTIISTGLPFNYNGDGIEIYNSNPLVDPVNAEPQIWVNAHLYGNPATTEKAMQAIAASPLAAFVEEFGPTGELVAGQQPHPGAMSFSGVCELLDQAKKMQVMALAWVAGPQDCFPSMTQPLPGTRLEDGNVELTPYGRMLADASFTGECIVPVQAIAPAPAPESIAQAAAQSPATSAPTGTNVGYRSASSGPATGLVLGALYAAIRLLG